MHFEEHFSAHYTYLITSSHAQKTGLFNLICIKSTVRQRRVSNSSRPATPLTFSLYYSLGLCTFLKGVVECGKFNVLKISYLKKQNSSMMLSLHVYVVSYTKLSREKP